MVASEDGPPAASSHTARSGIQRLQFASDLTFQKVLAQRVDEYFASTGRRRRDCWQLYLKTAIILVCFVTLYWLLVFVARTLWQGLALTAALGLVTAAIGFNIQHDGGHQSYCVLSASMPDLISQGRYRQPRPARAT